MKYSFIVEYKKTYSISFSNLTISLLTLKNAIFLSVNEYLIVSIEWTPKDTQYSKKNFIQATEKVFLFSFNYLNIKN